jgi:peptidoglycan hydrolase CwlO-like protein
MLSGSRRLTTIALAALLCAAALVASASPPASGQASLQSERSAAAKLRDAIAAESARIAATQESLASAEARLATLVAQVQHRQAQLVDTQNRLIRARVRLTRLERREAQAKRTLAENLVASYKAGTPNIVTVVLNANGFSDLIERVAFLKRVSRRNANILDFVRETRADVVRETKQLEGLRTRYAELANAAMADRDRANVLRGVLHKRQVSQLAARAGTAARLAAVRSRIGKLEREAAAAARAASSASTASNEAPTPPASGSSADAIVARVVAAANQIASTPYVWGGGHGGASGGYDCSGSVSYALAAGGLLSSPLDSTGFMSWGEPGPGRRITVYANAGHAFMYVDGRRFDTSALSGGGTRWSSAGRSTAGFVARHPPGL